MIQRKRQPALLLIAIAIGGISALVGGAERPAEPSAPPSAPPALAPATRPTATGSGIERVPSDDLVLKDLHSLGLVNGQLKLFRCASPVRDIAKAMTTTQPSDEQQHEARVRLQRLYDLGVRTDVSFQDPSGSSDEGKGSELNRSATLEKAACDAVGIQFVSRPMSNSGPHSMQTMSDEEIQKWLDEVTGDIFTAAKTGGVAFHCSAGHDRAGIVTAYIRIKYQHWPVDEAIEEMRRYGHNWVKYSADGGINSWHEQHLRSIAKTLAATADTSSDASR